MWLLRLKRLMLEREVLIGLFILGVGVMFADLLNDIGLNKYAAIVRGISLLFLLTPVHLGDFFTPQASAFTGTRYVH